MSKTNPNPNLSNVDAWQFKFGGWNPRYVIWAKKHGLTPEQMVAKDDKDWPGGCMVGYSLWIQEQVKMICQFYGVTPYDLRSIIGHCGDQDYHKVFDQWLEASIL